MLCDAAVCVYTEAMPRTCEALCPYSNCMLSQDLAAGIKKALSGDVETLLLEALMPPLQHEAHRLQQAMAVCGVCVFFNTFFFVFLHI